MKWLPRKAMAKPHKDDTTIEKIAKIRGIKDIDLFLNPTEDVLNDPYLMLNIDLASQRIIKAIENDENIVVSYDSDSDGLTSATTMLRYLSNYTDKVDYIYGQRNDGHGIEEMIKVKSLNPEKDAKRIENNKTNTDKIHNADLLILIDSSSNDVEACKFIKEKLEVDIIILDHHQIERHNPHVLMVNPQQKGCKYPNKHLSGAGVVFKVLQVMEDTLGQVDVWQYIDLVAVGMYSDMMRVDVLENRYLILKGLQNIKNVGLTRILKGANADFFKLNGDSIGFTISPLLNGVARMDDIKLAIDILLEDDDKVCKKLRLQMNKLNEERKERQKEIVEECMKNIDDSKKILIVTNVQSSKGFNGLIAQQLTEKYKRPVIVGRLHNGTLSGSFRSFGNFDMQKFLVDSCLVKEAKGHKQAGGIVVEEENIENLLHYIENNMPKIEEKEHFVIYDLEIDIKDMKQYVKTSEKLNKLTGRGFDKVLFRVNNITVEESKIIGKKEDTAKITTFDDIEMIKFRVDKEYASDLVVFDTIDVVGQLGLNEWYNFKLKERIITPQIILQDYMAK